MNEIENVRDEETLDPQDWQAMRALGHWMVAETSLVKVTRLGDYCVA